MITRPSFCPNYSNLIINCPVLKRSKITGQGVLQTRPTLHRIIKSCSRIWARSYENE
jgi:hypothetical protein